MNSLSEETKGLSYGTVPPFHAKEIIRLLAKVCTFRRLGGAVLSFQMVGITRHNFFSSFESITVPCPTTIHALKNYEAPGAVGD